MSEFLIFYLAGLIASFLTTLCAVIKDVKKTKVIRLYDIFVFFFCGLSSWLIIIPCLTCWCGDNKVIYKFKDKRKEVRK